MARRHAEKCSQDGGQIVFPLSRRGKKRKSCDRCSQRKLSCDGAAPCTRCSSAELECTYRRLTVAASSSLVPGREDAHSHRANGANAVSGFSGSSSHDTRIPINFLLGFTDPSPYGTSAAVMAADAEHFYLQDETESLSLQPYPNSDLLLGDGLLCDQGDFFPTLFEFSAHDLAEECPLSQDFSQSGRQAVLAERTSEMITQLSLTHNSMENRDRKAPVHFNKGLAESVFTETNLTHFVCTYFQRLHPYVPILHRPTFDLETAPLPLLMAVFLFGSLCCAPQDASLSAREYFDLAEEYVFGHPTLNHVLEVCSSGEDSPEEIEILQAALIIEIIQNGSSNSCTRGRLRLERHPRLVSAVRVSTLFRAKRRFPLHKLAGVNWKSFINDEIRLRYSGTRRVSALTWSARCSLFAGWQPGCSSRIASLPSFTTSLPKWQSLR